MPIDAAIPLEGRPFVPPNPVEGYLNALRVKSAQQQTQQQQQLFPLQKAALDEENQARALENQQRQLQVEQQKKLTQSWVDSMAPQQSNGTSAPEAGFRDPNTGEWVANPGAAQGSSPTPTSSKDTDSTPPADPWERFFTSAQRNGVLPKTILDMKTAHLEQLGKIATLDKDQREAEKAKIEAYGDHSQALLQISDPAARQQYYQSTTVPSLAKMGVTGLPPAVPSSGDLWAHVATANATRSLVTNVENQLKVAYQSLGQAKDEDDWNTRLKNLEGIVIPKVLEQFGPWTADAPQHARMLGMSPEQQLQAPGQQAKSDQEVITGDLTKLSHARNQNDFDATLPTLSPQGQAEAKRLVPDGKFDPATTPKLLQTGALTANQSMENQSRQAGLDVREQLLQTREAATNSMIQFRNWQEQFRSDQADKKINPAQDRDANLMNSLQTKEQEQWQQKQAFANVLWDASGKPLPDGTLVLDPTTKSGQELPLSSALRERLTAEYNRADATAKGLAEQQKAVRQRYGWGDKGVPANPPESGESTNTTALAAPLGIPGYNSTGPAVVTPRSTGSTPQPQTPQTQPGAPATPTKQNQPQSAKFTEAQVRQRATATGKDPEAAVKLARSKGLIP